MVEKKQFGHIGDREISLFTIKDGEHAVTLSEFGCTITSIIVPDRDKNPCDIVLGFDDLSDYEKPCDYIGATVGRFANRIKNGTFTLNEKEYRAFLNNGGNTLHGGQVGFDKRIWKGSIVDNDVIMSYVSPDGEEGYPGTLSVAVRFALTGGKLAINYSAVCDKDTVLNLTNHSYFNLNGAYSDVDIKNHRAQLLCDEFCENGSDCVPTGKVMKVDDTPFDMRMTEHLGTQLKTEHEQLLLFNGFDHNFVVKHESDKDLALCARFASPLTGIALSCYTTMPGVQLYTGNALSGCIGKGHIHYLPYMAFCLETQQFPDAPNKPGFPSALLKAGERFSSTTVYKFEMEK